MFSSYFIKKLTSVVSRPKHLYIIYSQDSMKVALAVATYNVPYAKINTAEDVRDFLEKNNSIGIKIDIEYEFKLTAANDCKKRWKQSPINEKRLKMIKAEYRSAYINENAANKLISSYINSYKRKT
ncbi:hypothetical protein PAEPH01_0252 [Pancytospora epiphaga]|nr:hypothetical protein PAEPH01_0252 [Pancytospora epiphaga]